jgi:heme exporter protein D
MEQSGNFFQMGGYAFYVWSSYGLTLIVLLINYLSPKFSEKKLIAELVKRSKLKKTDIK